MRADSIMPLRVETSPVVHIPMYSADGADDGTVRYMVQMLLTCLGSYFAHGNTYDVLVSDDVVFTQAAFESFVSGPQAADTEGSEA